MAEFKDKQIKLSDLQPIIHEEIFQTQWEGEQVDFKTMVGQKIGILDFSLIPSEFGENKFFASVQALADNDRKFWFNTSAVAIVKKLNVLKEKGKVPFSCKIVAVKSKVGRTYYDLE